MKLKITQNEYGRFNLIGDESSMAFYLRIVDDTGKTISKTDGEKEIRAVLHYGDGDDKVNEFNNLFSLGKIDEIFDICVDYMKRIYTTGGDYKKDMQFFMELYEANRQEIEENLKQEKIAEAEKQLEMAKNIICPSLDGVWNNYIEKQKEEVKRQIDYKKKDLSELKEDGEKYKKLSLEIVELENTLSPVRRCNN